MKYNNTQKLVSDISGYCGLDEPGARDDGYYERKDKVAAYHYLVDCVYAIDDINPDHTNIPAALKFLKKLQDSNQDDSYHMFVELRDI